MKLKTKIILLLVCLTSFHLFSQNCPWILKDSLRLAQIILKQRKKPCDKITVVKYCLKFHNNKFASYDLGYYLIDGNKIPSIEIMEAKNPCRLERFNSLYYIHHSLIINDNSKKDIIYLKIHDSIITDSYLNKGYRSEDEKKEMIESTIKESEKFDKEIELYYDIIKSYTEDYEKIGKKEAKKKYLEALKSNKIYWKNNWD